MQCEEHSATSTHWGGPIRSRIEPQDVAQRTRQMCSKARSRITVTAPGHKCGDGVFLIREITDPPTPRTTSAGQAGGMQGTPLQPAQLREVREM